MTNYITEHLLLYLVRFLMSVKRLLNQVVHAYFADSTSIVSNFPRLFCVF